MAMATELLAVGKPAEIVEVQYGIAPLSAQRFVDLFAVNGKPL